MYFRVDVRSGDVQPVSDVAARPPIAPWPAPGANARRTITSEERTLSVLEGEPGDAARKKTVWQFTVPGSGAGWIPWRVVQGNTVTYAWREEVPGQRYQYREIVRAMDTTSGKVLWERVGPYHDPPGAAAVGADQLVVDQDGEVVFLETKTGRVVRRIAKTEEAFAVASPRPGQLWVAAGNVIECIDEGSAKTVWRTSKQGELLWLLPIPGGDDWLVKTAKQTIRMRAADGRQLWSAPSTSASRPLVSGDRIYEGTLVVKDAHRRAEMTVVARDLRSGKALREYALGPYEGFFDSASVAVVDARDGWVEVAAEFIVLD